MCRLTSFEADRIAPLPPLSRTAGAWRHTACPAAPASAWTARSPPAMWCHGELGGQARQGARAAVARPRGGEAARGACCEGRFGRAAAVSCRPRVGHRHAPTLLPTPCPPNFQVLRLPAGKGHLLRANVQQGRAAHGARSPGVPGAAAATRAFGGLGGGAKARGQGLPCPEPTRRARASQELHSCGRVLSEGGSPRIARPLQTRASVSRSQTGGTSPANPRVAAPPAQVRSVATGAPFLLEARRAGHLPSAPLRARRTLTRPSPRRSGASRPTSPSWRTCCATPTSSGARPPRASSRSIQRSCSRKLGGPWISSSARGSASHGGAD
jgi:hypothetical protein